MSLAASNNKFIIKSNLNPCVNYIQLILFEEATFMGLLYIHFTKEISNISSKELFCHILLHGECDTSALFFSLANLRCVLENYLFWLPFCCKTSIKLLITGITSITTLTVLAYERYCLVSCPFSSAHLSNTGAKISICVIWIYSLLLTTPP